jgi:hypothetical protein
MTQACKSAKISLNPSERRGRAGDETRTRDIFLGKEVLYQLSYTREAKEEYERADNNVNPIRRPAQGTCALQSQVAPRIARRCSGVLEPVAKA